MGWITAVAHTWEAFEASTLALNPTSVSRIKQHRISPRMEHRISPGWSTESVPGWSTELVPDGAQNQSLMQHRISPRWSTESVPGCSTESVHGWSISRHIGCYITVRRPSREWARGLTQQGGRHMYVQWFSGGHHLHSPQGVIVSILHKVMFSKYLSLG